MESVYLMIYVDDIVIITNYTTRISQLKEHLFSHLYTKDFGYLKYFFSMEVAQSEETTVIEQRKYALDILEEIGLQIANPIIVLYVAAEKTILTITRLDISYAVGVVTHFMHNPQIKN